MKEENLRWSYSFSDWVKSKSYFPLKEHGFSKSLIECSNFYNYRSHRRFESLGASLTFLGRRQTSQWFFQADSSLNQYWYIVSLLMAHIFFHILLLSICRRFNYSYWNHLKWYFLPVSTCNPWPERCCSKEIYHLPHLTADIIIVMIVLQSLIEQ